MDELPLGVWADMLEEAGQPTDDLRAWIACGLAGGGEDWRLAHGYCHLALGCPGEGGVPGEWLDWGVGNGCRHHYDCEFGCSGDMARGRGCNDYGAGVGYPEH